MLEVHQIDVWRQVPILLCLPAQVAFVLIVTTPRLGAGQWWRNYVTRALVLKSSTLLLLIFAASVGYLFADTHGRQRVNWAWPDDRIVCICYWLVTAAIWYQLVALVRQRFGSRD